MTILFDLWQDIQSVFITAVCAYILIIVMLRLSGKRSLSKLNIFDSIITIALGSILASIIITKSVTLMDGFVAVAILLIAQQIITLSSLRWPIVEDLINPRPTIVFEQGDFIREKMKQSRITRDEIYAEVRQQGFICLDDVFAIVVESNGNLSVLGKKDHIYRSTLQNLDSHDRKKA